MLRAPGAEQGRDDNHAFPAQLSEGFSPHNPFCCLFQDIWEHKPLCLLAPLIAKGKKRRQEEELASEYNFAKLSENSWCLSPRPWAIRSSSIALSLPLLAPAHPGYDTFHHDNSKGVYYYNCTN